MATIIVRSSDDVYHAREDYAKACGKLAAQVMEYKIVRFNYRWKGSRRTKKEMSHAFDLAYHNAKKDFDKIIGDEFPKSLEPEIPAYAMSVLGFRPDDVLNSAA